MARRIIHLSRREAETKRVQAVPPRSHWRIAIDPDTLQARIVLHTGDGFVPEVEGHEDLFPLEMGFEREDGYLEGGDWVVVTTPSRRSHDGRYRGLLD